VRVLEIFDSLQGEGVWTGVPMTFVRLAGCNAPALGLDCVRWCDTRESWSAAGEELSAESVAGRVTLPRVCLTGGEPLLQPEGVGELIARLHARSVRVHVETNGTLPLPPGEGPDWVTVSPKPPAYEVVPALEGHVDELKLVVDESFSPAAAQRLSESHPEAVVCLQPETGEGPAGVRRAIALVRRHPQWRLSLQTHKLLGIR